MTARETHRDDLFDLAVNTPAGFTVDEARRRLRLTHPQVNKAIHDLRRFLADEADTINLTCDPQGQGERWLYRLVGTLDEVRNWTRNRVRDSESRVRTMQAMMASIVTATSGRTVEGKKARVMERAFRRLVEDLDQIMDDATA